MAATGWRRALLASALGGALLAGCGSSGSATKSSSSTEVTPAISAEDGANTRANLRTLATGEETYFTDHATYTSDSAALARSGFKRAPGTDTESLLAGVDGAKGYCLIGGVSAAGPWFLYDSKIRGGLIPQLFGQQSAAEATCSDPNVTDYQLID